MITVEKCRALLGDYSSTDEEIESLRSALYSTTELAFEVYWTDSNTGSKNPFGFFSNTIDVDTLLICNEKSTKQQ